MTIVHQWASATPTCHYPLQFWSDSPKCLSNDLSNDGDQRLLLSLYSSLCWPVCRVCQYFKATHQEKKFEKKCDQLPVLLTQQPVHGCTVNCLLLFEIIAWPWFYFERTFKLSCSQLGKKSKTQALGLADQYKANENIKMLCGMLDGLVFMQVADVKRGLAVNSILFVRFSSNCRRSRSK